MTIKELERLAKELKRVGSDLDNPYNVVQYARIHFSGNVPRVETMPTLSEFGLSGDPEQYIRDEECKVRDEFEKKQRTVNIIACVIYISFLAYLLWSDNLGMFIGLVWLLFCIPTITAIIYDKKTREAEKNAAVDYKARYRLYKDRLLAYSYWINVRSLSFWDSLDGHQFENAVADLYRRRGYQARVSPPGGDGGIDIVLTKEGECPIAVQCKAHNNPVAPSVIRDLYGTMVANGYSKGMLVSKTGFTTGVLDFAQGKPIQLVDLKDLMRMSSELTN